MKSYELQPTYENILNTYLQNTINRNTDIHRFISILNTVEGNTSIALDGRWGSGKTFFVKQVKLILDALNDNLDSSHKDDFDKIRTYWNQFNQHMFKKGELIELQ